MNMLEAYCTVCGKLYQYIQSIPIPPDRCTECSDKLLKEKLEMNVRDSVRPIGHGEKGEIGLTVVVALAFLLMIVTVIFVASPPWTGGVTISGNSTTPDWLIWYFLLK